MFLILLSSVMLALDAPKLDAGGAAARAITGVEWALNMLFAIEMAIKLTLKVCGRYRPMGATMCACMLLSHASSKWESPSSG